MQLGAELDADLVVLALLRPIGGESAEEAAEEMELRREETLTALNSAIGHRTSEGTVRVRPELIFADDAGSAIDRYAESNGIDLIVVGKHGLDRSFRPRMGGVAEYLLRNSRWAVLVVESS
jgi:nucleotide-binding universal stress UspA family protein